MDTQMVFRRWLHSSRTQSVEQKEIQLVTFFFFKEEVLCHSPHGTTVRMTEIINLEELCAPGSKSISSSIAIFLGISLRRFNIPTTISKCQPILGRAVCHQDDDYNILIPAVTLPHR